MIHSVSLYSIRALIIIRYSYPLNLLFFHSTQQLCTPYKYLDPSLSEIFTEFSFHSVTIELILSLNFVLLHLSCLLMYLFQILLCYNLKFVSKEFVSNLFDICSNLKRLFFSNHNPILMPEFQCL